MYVYIHTCICICTHLLYTHIYIKCLSKGVEFLPIYLEKIKKKDKKVFTSYWEVTGK